MVLSLFSPKDHFETLVWVYNVESRIERDLVPVFQSNSECSIIIFAPGIYKLARELYQIAGLQAHIKEWATTPDSDLIVCGHSLGAALAEMALIFLRSDFEENIERIGGY